MAQLYLGKPHWDHLQGVALSPPAALRFQRLKRSQQARGEADETYPRGAPGEVPTGV